MSLQNTRCCWLHSSPTCTLAGTAQIVPGSAACCCAYAAACKICQVTVTPAVLHHALSSAMSCHLVRTFAEGLSLRNKAHSCCCSCSDSRSILFSSSTSANSTCGAVAAACHSFCEAVIAACSNIVYCCKCVKQQNRSRMSHTAVQCVFLLSQLTCSIAANAEPTTIQSNQRWPDCSALTPVQN